MGDHGGAAKVVGELVHHLGELAGILDMLRSIPWIAMLKEEKRMSLGRIRRSSTRTTRPSSIQARPTEQALPRCSLAVSKSMAIVFKAASRFLPSF